MSSTTLGIAWLASLNTLTRTLTWKVRVVIVMALIEEEATGSQDDDSFCWPRRRSTSRRDFGEDSSDGDEACIPIRGASRRDGDGSSVP